MKKNKHFSRKGKKLPKKVRSAPSVTFFAMRYIGNWRYHPKARKKVLALLRTVYAVSTGRGHIALCAVYSGHHSAETRIKIMEALAKRYGIEFPVPVTSCTADNGVMLDKRGRVQCWTSMTEDHPNMQQHVGSKHRPTFKEE